MFHKLKVLFCKITLFSLFLFVFVLRLLIRSFDVSAYRMFEGASEKYVKAGERDGGIFERLLRKILFLHSRIRNGHVSDVLMYWCLMYWCIDAQVSDAQTQRPSIPTFELCASYFKMSLMTVIIIKTRYIISFTLCQICVVYRISVSQDQVYWNVLFFSAY